LGTEGPDSTARTELPGTEPKASHQGAEQIFRREIVGRIMSRLGASSGQSKLAVVPTLPDPTLYRKRNG